MNATLSSADDSKLSADQMSALTELLKGVEAKIKDPKAKIKGSELINNVAITGIDKYLAFHPARGVGKEKYLAFDGAQGVSRANLYRDAFKSSKSDFYKEIMLYALLSSKDDKILQRDLIVGEPLKIELKANLQARTLKAAGNDKEKAAFYRSKLDKMIDDVVESVNMHGTLSDAISRRINNFELRNVGSLRQSDC